MVNIMNKKERGFSLIEAMISIVILSIGLLGASRMQLSSISATHLARQRVDATSMATQRLEVLRDSGLCVVDAGTTPITPIQTSTTYYLKVECPSTTVALVTVTWSDSKGVTDNVTLHTSVAALS